MILNEKLYRAAFSMGNMKNLLLTAILLQPLSVLQAADDIKPKPNVLFISVDDLNDWVGCLGGHPQTKTPNLDRFAASSRSDKYDRFVTKFFLADLYVCGSAPKTGPISSTIIARTRRLSILPY